MDELFISGAKNSGFETQNSENNFSKKLCIYLETVGYVYELDAHKNGKGI